MRVEIKNGNPLAAALKRMYGPNSDAVKYTKPAADTVLKKPLYAAVMAWRSYNTEGVLALAIEHCVDGGDHRSGGICCSIIAPGRDERVAAFAIFGCALGSTMQSNLHARGESYRGSVSMGRLAQITHEIDVFDVVDSGDFRNGGRMKIVASNNLPVAHAAFAVEQPLNNGLSSRGAFLMSVTRHVPGAHGMEPAKTNDHRTAKLADTGLLHAHDNSPALQTRATF